MPGAAAVVDGVVFGLLGVELAGGLPALDAVDVAVAVDVDVGVGVGVAVGVDVEQSGLVITLLSSVTAPARASTRPWTVAPVFSVAEVCARIVPMKLVVLSRVADDPTCQYTLHALPPLMNLTLLLGAVTNVVPALKMNTAAGSPWAFKVRLPVRAMPLDAS